MQHSLEELLDGMRSADPTVRDGWVYAELSDGIRSGRFDQDHDVIRASAVQSLKLEHIYARTFAPLILRWLVLAGDRSSEVFDDFAAWYVAEPDTRGYDEKLGWLHGVAHGADYIKACVEKNIISGSRALEVLAQRVCAPATPWADQEDARIVAAVCVALGSSDVDVETWCLTIDRALDEFEAEARSGGIAHPPTWLSNLYHVESTTYVVLTEAHQASDDRNTRVRSHASDVIRRMTPWLFDTSSTS